MVSNPTPTRVSCPGASGITREQLVKRFHLPVHEASAQLGVTPVVLKRVCLRHGIKRWPYRGVGRTPHLASVALSSISTTPATSHSSHSSGDQVAPQASAGSASLCGTPRSSGGAAARQQQQQWGQQGEGDMHSNAAERGPVGGAEQLLSGLDALAAAAAMQPNSARAAQAQAPPQQQWEGSRPRVDSSAEAGQAAVAGPSVAAAAPSVAGEAGRAAPSGHSVERRWDPWGPPPAAAGGELSAAHQLAAYLNSCLPGQAATDAAEQSVHQRPGGARPWAAPEHHHHHHHPQQPQQQPQEQQQYLHPSQHSWGAHPAWLPYGGPPGATYPPHWEDYYGRHPYRGGPPAGWPSGPSVPPSVPPPGWHSAPSVPPPGWHGAPGGPPGDPHGHYSEASCGPRAPWQGHVDWQPHPGPSPHPSLASSGAFNPAPRYAAVGDAPPPYGAPGSYGAWPPSAAGAGPPPYSARPLDALSAEPAVFSSWNSVLQDMRQRVEADRAAAAAATAAAAAAAGSGPTPPAEWSSARPGSQQAQQAAAGPSRARTSPFAAPAAPRAAQAAEEEGSSAPAAVARLAAAMQPEQPSSRQQAAGAAGSVAAAAPAAGASTASPPAAPAPPAPVALATAREPAAAAAAGAPVTCPPAMREQALALLSFLRQGADILSSSSSTSSDDMAMCEQLATAMCDATRALVLGIQKADPAGRKP